MTEHSTIDDLMQFRREKLAQLQAKGTDPYPGTTNRTHTNAEILEAFEVYAEDKTEVTLVGRIRNLRAHGGSTFATIEDGSARIQVYFQRDTLGDAVYEEIKLLDLGDFLEATGTVFRTKTDQETLQISAFRLLTKALRPLPGEWFGLKDAEQRYRKRYLDFLLNPEVKQRIVVRSRVLHTLRQFLTERGFIEIENPILETAASGAMADPFATHIKAYNLPLFLRICAGELWQKRSLVGGFEKVFDLGRAFRNEGVSHEHNPEFTMLEFYWAYASLEENMQLHEELFERLAIEIFGQTSFAFEDKTLDFKPPFPRKTFRQVIIDEAGIDIEQYPTREALYPLLDELDIHYDKGDSHGRLLDELYKHTTRPKLIQPVFITEYPVELKPLAKKVPERPQYVDVFQLLIAGKEVSNSYNELNDPVDQKERFMEQAGLLEGGDEEAMRIDLDYVEALEYGMPPATGTGIGIDRLVSLLTDAHHLREIIAYPLMKPNAAREEPMRTTTPPHQLESSQPISSSGAGPYLSIDSEVKSAYPDIRVAVAVIEGITIQSSHPELEAEKAAVLQELEKLPREHWKIHPHLQAYRALYKSFGIDPSSKRPSADALLHRISRGKGLYAVNTLVDAYNLASAKNALCMAAYDLDQVALPLTLRLSRDGEAISLIGEAEPTTMEAGKLVYSDGEGLTCIHFNYRDADRTKVTDGTTRAILFVDGCGEIETDAIVRALDEAVELVTRFNGGQVSERFLV